MRFPVFKAFGAALAYLAGHALLLLKALWLPALLLIAAVTAVMPGYLDAAIAVLGLGLNPDPNEVLAVMPPVMRAGGILMLASAVLYPMMMVAALRHVVRGDDMKAPFYLGFGGDELRTLGAYVLIFIMMIVVYLVFVLALLVVGGVLSLVSPALGGVAALIASIAGIIGFLWFLMRLSVTFPAILATRSFGIAQSWRATKGNSARLLGYWTLIFILMMIAGGVYFSIFLADFFPLYGEIFEAGADQAAAQEVNRKMLELQREYYDMGNAKFWPFAIGTYFYTIVMTALMSVAAGIAWRYLTDREGPGAEASRTALAA